ncbi:unnamed protein product [Anisakis simplex]|uniref:Glycoside hydrolase family 15 n=1 Tax=Anisakis simplex TaxID=6269 RepID=A0A0M3J9L3_ANISI|nr:unnamed protein product [Anisakis simplex]
MFIKMRKVIEWIYTFYPDPNDWLHNGTLTNSYKELIDVLKNTTFDDENNDENAATRGWMWLCCNELGLMQTTDQGRNVFGSMLPLDYYIDICMDSFGDDVNITSIRDRNIAFRNKYKDGEDYKVHRITLIDFIL